MLTGLDGYARHFGTPADQLLRMPKADDAEGMAQLWGKLGRPDTPEAYTFDGLDKMSEGDQAFINSFRAKAHAAGIPQAHMSVMMGHLSEALATVDGQLEEQTVAAREAATAELKKAWGDKYDVMRNDIPASLQWLGEKAGLIQPGDAEGLNGLVKALNVGGEADNPALMRLMGALADLRAEGGSLPGTGKAVPPVASTEASREAARVKLTEFNADKDKMDALYDTRKPGHIAAKEEWQRLVEASSPPPSEPGA